MTLLELDGISIRFGGLAALQDVGITAPAGQVTGLIGPNGSGKTTLFDVMSGFARPISGRVVFDGRDITALPAHLRANLGISRTFQHLELFGTLTVRENVLAAVEHKAGGAARTAQSAARQALEMVGLASLADVPANQLPPGRARLLELARALVVEPRLLLLDEPSSGLDETETHTIGQLLQRLAAEGLAVVLAEHDMTLVMSVSHTVHVLDFGHLIASAPPAEIRHNPAVRTAYLGKRDPSTRLRRVPDADTGPRPALELSGITASYGTATVLRGVDLTVPAGRIFALLGPNGAGKSTTLKVVSGQLRPDQGTVRVLGHDVTGAAPDALARAGVCLVPEGRGVFPNLTVDENLRMATFRPRPLEDVQDQAFTLFPRLAERRNQVAGTLSGGEQRMLAVARALTTRTAVLLLDELSAGLSPQALADLYEKIRAIADQGVAVLLVEQYSQEVLDVADTAGLLIHGRIREQGSPQVIETHLAASYLGEISGNLRPAQGRHEVGEERAPNVRQARPDAAGSPLPGPDREEAPGPPIAAEQAAETARPFRHPDAEREATGFGGLRSATGVLLCGAGLAILIVSLVMTRGAATLQQQIHALALAPIGLAVTVFGAAGWLQSSVSRYLRTWSAVLARTRGGRGGTASTEPPGNGRDA